MQRSVAVDENSDIQEEIEVKLDHEFETISFAKKIEAEDDVFGQKGDQLKKLSGLSPEFKRKVSRQLTKVQNIDSSGTAGSKAVDPIYSYSSGYSIFDVVLPPYNLDYLAKIYEISAPHYAAVNAKTANIVGLGYTYVNSYKTQNILDNISNDADKLQKVRKKIDRYKQGLDLWIDSTNKRDTFLETLKKVWVDYESTGNGYIEVGRTTEGNVGYIGHIPSVTMRVRTQRDGYVQIVGRIATFFRNYGDKTTSNPVGNDANPNEIIHLKNYSPSNTYYGIPDIIAAKNSLAGAEYADRFNLDYFEYKAVPRYVIVVQGAKLSAEAQNNIMSFFRTGLKGKNHRTLFLPLPAGDNITFKMEPVEAGVQDSSFTNYRKQTISDILMAHRVPITKVSIADATSVAVAQDADKTFKEQVCQPAQSILEKKLNMIISEVTDSLLIHLNELTLTDANTQSQIDQRYVVSQILTPNEVREKSLGMSGIPGGDKVVQLKQAPGSTQQNAQQTAQATKSRQQDIERSNNQPDKQATGRNAKGGGRSTP